MRLPFLWLRNIKVPGYVLDFLCHFLVFPFRFLCLDLAAFCSLSII